MMLSGGTIHTSGSPPTLLGTSRPEDHCFVICREVRPRELDLAAHSRETTDSSCEWRIGGDARRSTSGEGVKR